MPRGRDRLNLNLTPTNAATIQKMEWRVSEKGATLPQAGDEGGSQNSHSGLRLLALKGHTWGHRVARRVYYQIYTQETWSRVFMGMFFW